MAEDLFAVLSRFHHEVALPQIEAMMEAKLRGEISSLRGEFLTHFDAFYVRFDRQESEHHALAAAVARLGSDHHGLVAAVARLESDHHALAAAVARLGSDHHALAAAVARLEAR